MFVLNGIESQGRRRIKVSWLWRYCRACHASRSRPFRAQPCWIRFAAASRGLFDHRLFAAVNWKGNLCRSCEMHGCLATVRSFTWEFVAKPILERNEYYFLIGVQRALTVSVPIRKPLLTRLLVFISLLGTCRRLRAQFEAPAEALRQTRKTPERTDEAFFR